jgi:uncharacterized protein YgiM (DUF1202 family)
MLALLLLLQAPSPEGREQYVVTHTAYVHSAPTRTSPILRKAEFGERLRVVSVENSWAKIALEGQATGFLKTASLSDDRPSITSEAGLQELLAKGQEGHRICEFGSSPEVLLRNTPEIDAAYLELDGLQQRTNPRDRAALEAKLLEFRRGGRLGEFSPLGQDEPSKDRSPHEDKPLKPGGYLVNVWGLAGHEQPTRISPIVWKFRHGDRVELVDVEGRWAKLDLGKGKVGYVPRSALVLPEAYRHGPGEK